MPVEAAETELGETESEGPDRPVGHYVWARGEKVAMCGKRILGVQASSDSLVCPRCHELRLMWEQIEDVSY